jgi:hypothetical protein
MAGVLKGIDFVKGGDRTYDEALSALEKGEESDVKNFPTATRTGQGLGAALGAGKAVQMAKRLGTGAEAAREIASDIPTPTGKAKVVDRSGTRVVSKDPERRPADNDWWVEQDSKMNASKRRTDYFDELQTGKARDLERERNLDLDYRDASGRRKPATDWGSMVKKDKPSFEDIDKTYNPPSSNTPKADPNAWGDKLRETHSAKPAMDLPSGTLQERTIPGRSVYKEGANAPAKGVFANADDKVLSDVDANVAKQMGFESVQAMEEWLAKWKAK